MFQGKYTCLQIVQALRLYCEHKSFRKVEAICKIGKSSIHRWSQTIGIIGYSKRKTRLGVRKKRFSKYYKIRGFISKLFSQDKTSIFSLAQIKGMVSSRFGLSPSISCIRNILRELNIGRKAFVKGFISKDPNALKQQREDFLDRLKNISNDEIVCVDETGFCNIGNKTMVWYPKGKIIKDPFLARKRERFSVCMAISSHGVIQSTKQTIPFNKETFIAFLSDLLPKLSPIQRFIIMDNVSFHKSKDVLDLVQSYNVEVIFIPPYSPRCNPIEEVFSIVKRSFRKQFAISNQFESSIDYELAKQYKDFSPYYNHTRRYEP
jgi:transposase